MTQNAKIRHAWADVARGICVILVVAMHAYQLLYVQWFDVGDITRAWDALVSATQPFRMPLFFLISGYLASRAIQRRWGDVVRKRVWSVLYLYALWLVIYVAVRVIRVSVEGRSIPWADYALEFLWPASSLWYLYALVLYFVLVKLMLALPWWLLVGAGALISVAGTSFFEDGTVQYLLRCFVFFALGSRQPQVLEFVTARASWWRFGAAVVVYALMSALTLWAGKQTPGLITLAGIVGIVTMLWFSKLIAAGTIARPLRYIGQNTLAIFVLHPILLSLTATALFLAPSLTELLRSSTVFVALLPALLVAGIVGFSLAIETVCNRIGLGILFALPGAAAPASASPALASEDR